MDKIKELVEANIYNLLLKEGFTSLEDIVQTNLTDLEEIVGSYDAAKNLVYTASERLLNKKILKAIEFDLWNHISTGCKSIDEIIFGGIPTVGISEVYGCSGVGKTQFCLQLALNIQLPSESKNTGKEVVFLCTEDPFPSKRLDQLATAFRLKHNTDLKFEDHIYIKHLTDTVQLQKCLLNELPYFLSTKNAGLIIVDSIAGIFRSDNKNVDYIKRSQEFLNICKTLNRLQDCYNCAILIVNQVSDNISSGTSEPTLGLSWANNINHRYSITRSVGTPIRKFEVIFSPEVPAQSCDFLITPQGIVGTDIF